MQYVSSYEPVADIRDLIQVDDVMEDEELRFGPNGGLVFAMEFLLENLDWLEGVLGEEEDDYILFDCPGQIGRLIGQECLCKALFPDRALHAHACDEEVGGPTTGMELPRLRDLRTRLSLHGGRRQVYLWGDGSSQLHGKPGTSCSQRSFKGELLA